MSAAHPIAATDAPKAADYAAVLSYDPLTGAFVWKVDRGQRAKAGMAAGSTSRDGYHQISVFGQTYVAHRLAWIMSFGKWPEGQIDHVNGNRSDNRLINLRVCSIAENAQNRAARENVGTYNVRGRWVARIKINSVDTYLGGFETRDEAHAAYCGAKRVLHRFAPDVRYVGAPDKAEA